ncbi:MAG: hypothetical protein MJZ74_02100 [Muribaculaceae bacterium]|nr:hypothetical protein [Muribaculaceae bacterium]
MNKSILAVLVGAAMALCGVAQDKSDESPLSLGLQGGVGYMTTTGELNDYFGGAAVFTGGVTADYNRLRLKVDFDYGQPKVNNGNPFNVRNESGDDLQLVGNSNVSQVSLGAQIGYKVFGRGRVSVTPAAGVFYTRYGMTLNDVEWKKDDKGTPYVIVTGSRDAHLSNTSWIASVDVDIKLGEHITKEPFFLNQRYSRLSTGVRVTPWVAGGKVKCADPAASGVYCGVTVRVTGFMQSLGF